MESLKIVEEICNAEKIAFTVAAHPYPDECYVRVDGGDYGRLCKLLHKRIHSPVKMFFAEDRRVENKVFTLSCVFLHEQKRSWLIIQRDVSAADPVFASMAKDIYSANLFEREIKEMFGIQPQGHPDARRLRLHDEVWPQEQFPLRKDFNPAAPAAQAQPLPVDGRYVFKRVDGEGIFEVPVGPVHAGIIGPGHFRFSVAGEPIINLELRLGWTHRGVEKLLEGKTIAQAASIFECISGDTVFAYSLVFCQCVEKISGVTVPLRAQLVRALCLELERLYNHANDMGGIALDVGFSFPAQFASMIKETVLGINQGFCGSRYLKGVNCQGGVRPGIDGAKLGSIRAALPGIANDFSSLEEMLFSSVSFMDRVDSTGILRAKTAFDLGISGVAARASGIGSDARKALPGIYDSLSFSVVKESGGDVAARLKVRCREVKESIAIIGQCLERLQACPVEDAAAFVPKPGFALGCVEAWRGPVRVWLKLNSSGGSIERCKIVDPSFHNWEGLAFAVLGNIIPDFPLCNKSFDLSYSGNDL